MTFVVGLVIQGDSSDAKRALAETSAETAKLGAATRTATTQTTAAGNAMRKASADAQALANAQRGATIETGNLAAQFNDIGVQLAGGQSPLLIALQQGTQITQAFGNAGASGIVRGLGSAFLSVLSPINLITIAIIAFGGTAIQWLSSTAEEAETLEDRFKSLKEATDAYGSAADALEVPLDKLIKKYGFLAEEVRGVQRSQAELARGNAQQALQGLISDFGSPELAVYDGDSIEAQFRIRQSLLERLTAGEAEYRQAVQAGNTAQMVALAAEEQSIKAQLAGLRGFQSSLQQIAADYDITITQAAGLAAATERVRDSARGSADEQVAAATALREYLVLVFGSVEAAEEKTGGLVTKLDSAAQAAADIAAADLAGGIGAGADEAARLAGNLSVAAANYAALRKRTGQGGPDAARSAVQFGAVYLDGEALVPPVIGAGLPKATPKVRGSGGGGARDEADSVQKLIEKLQAEQAQLQETDPLQKALLGYRKELALATGEQRTQIEELVATNLKAEAATESLAFAAQSVGDALIDALMGGKNAGEQLIQTLIKAGLQAALLGQGPLAGLFGGGGQTTGGVGGLLGGLLGGFLKRAGGGPVYGPGTGTSDDVPALLSNGEYVVNARAAARHRAVLDAMNSGGLPGFAVGGSVGGSGAGQGGGAFASGGGNGGRLRIELGEGLVAQILDQAREGSIEITQNGLATYHEKVLPGAVRDISNAPRDRR